MTLDASDCSVTRTAFQTQVPHDGWPKVDRRTPEQGLAGLVKQTATRRVSPRNAWNRES